MRNVITFRLGSLFRFELDDYGLYIAIGSKDWWQEFSLGGPMVRWIVKDRGLNHG